MARSASPSPTRLAVIRRYSIAVLSVAVALGLALLLRRFEGMAVASFLMAIALTAWYAGLGAGFLAIVLSTLSVDYFFTPPLYKFNADLSDLPYLVVFTLFGLVFSWFSASLRRTEQQLRQAHKELELKVAERTAALRRSEALLTEGERLSHTGTWALDTATREVVLSSAETYRLFGFEPEKGAPSFEEFAQRIHPDDRERVLRPFVDRTVDDYEADFRTVLPDGTIRHIHGAGHPIFNDTGDLVEFVGSAMDVTERKRIEEALRQTEYYLTEGERLTNTGSYAWEAAKGLVHTSAELLRLFGFDPEQPAPVHATFRERVHPDDLAMFDALGERSMREGIGLDWVYRIVLPDGTLKYLHVVARPVFGASGEVVGNIGTTRDITERKRAEEAVRRSEKELREVVETIPAMVWRALPDGSNAFVNKQWAEYTGLSAEQASCSGWQRTVHPEDLGGHLEKWRVCAATGEPYEHEARFRRAADGEYRWFFSKGMPVRDEQGSILKWHGIMTDIEDRKRAAEALRRSEAYLAESQRLTHTGSWAVNAVAGKTVYWSDEMFRIFGLDPQHGPPTSEAFWERVHPEDRDSVYELMRKAAREKTEYEHDHRIVLPDGTVKHIHAIGHPVPNRTGDAAEFVGTAIDVTERKRAEEEHERLRQLQAELARLNRVSVMGELTASLGHEIKQPIAAAVSNAEACLLWLAREQPDLAEVREAATEMVKDARRAAEIVTRVRALFKNDEIKREVLDLNEVITDTMSLIDEEAGGRLISMRAELDPELPRISADRVQLQQVLTNLMLNGLEAMKGAKGELIIRSRRDQEGRALISVSDVGVGLPVGEGDKIFDAFFTTKPQGTGMGLAISRSIIESHGGRLWATANSGDGATFSFSLPKEVVEKT